MKGVKDVKGVKVKGVKAQGMKAPRHLIVFTLFTSFTLFMGSVFAVSAVPQKTTKDKLYTKEQSTRGAAVFAKLCERCHIPEKVPTGKKPDPPVIGVKFLETWQDRTLGELFATIYTTMPSDGSATLTTDQTVDLVAHLLQANGFPEGTTPLKNDDAMKAVVIVK